MNAGTMTAYENLKRAIVSVDGNVLSSSAGEREMFLEGCSAIVRDLLVRALLAKSQANEATVKNFLDTIEVVI